MMTSTPARCATASAATIAAGAFAPCTTASATRMWAGGNRRWMVWTMSCSAAPLREVTTPIRRGNSGSARFLASANRPSAASLRLSSSSARAWAPAPAGSTKSTYSCSRPSRSNTPSLPRTRSRCPASIGVRWRWAVVRHITAGIDDALSLSTK